MTVCLLERVRNYKKGRMLDSNKLHIRFTHVSIPPQTLKFSKCVEKISFKLMHLKMVSHSFHHVLAHPECVCIKKGFSIILI